MLPIIDSEYFCLYIVSLAAHFQPRVLFQSTVPFPVLHTHSEMFIFLTSDKPICQDRAIWNYFSFSQFLIFVTTRVVFLYQVLLGIASHTK